MLRRLYAWTLRLAAHRHALPALAGIAFIESSVFPIPPLVMMAPMILARPRDAWRIAAVATVASVAGGLAGYAVGALLYDAVGRPILDFYGYGDRFAELQGLYARWGAWLILVSTVTPLPYKLITIGSGVMGLDPLVFALASLGARGTRFFVFSAVLWRFGAPLGRLLEERIGMITALFLLVAAGGFVAARYLAGLI